MVRSQALNAARRAAAALVAIVVAGCGDSAPSPNAAADSPKATTAAKPAPSAPVQPLTADEARRCALAPCPAGTKVITSAKSEGTFFACETEPLADYANFVIGLVSMQASFGVRSNIDPETGEPEQTGATKEMLDGLRAAAGVSTFDQAVTHCLRGPHKRRLTVINFKPDHSSVWVEDEATSQAFWVPATVIDRAPG